MPDVFLSYSREDQDRARRFAEALQADGLTVWWDTELRSGEAYDQVTEQALRDARAVVVLWSTRSVGSRWVRAEATLADRNRTLVPAMIEPCERPIMFELTQTADLTAWDGDRRDPKWQAFVKDVRQFLATSPKASAATPASGGEAAPLPALKRGGRPSIAVLPFTNRSGIREDDVFAGGMVEDIVAALSLSRTAKVMASSATASYRNQAVDLRAIGRELGARYILEGNVRRVGQELRVSSQLVEAETGNILWTQKFDRPLEEMAALQEDLVMDVAGHVGAQLTRIETEKALRKPGDLTAWEAVMRSMAAYVRIGLQSAPAAVTEAEKAVAIAPDYGVGHGALALALGTLYAWSDMDPALRERVRHHLDRAIELDRDNPTVLWMVGWAYVLIGQADDSLEYTQRSVDLNPNISTGRMALAYSAYRLGMPDECIAQVEAAVRLAPRGHMLYWLYSIRSTALYQAGRTEEAMAENTRALHLNPSYPASLTMRMVIAEALGRTDDVRDTYARLRKADPEATGEIHARRLEFFTGPAPNSDAPQRFRKAWRQAEDLATA